MFVRGVHAEVQDVLLRDPQVLDELPERVLEPCGLEAPFVGRNACDRVVEPDVRVFPREGALK
jgi:hypothetical protein